MTRSVPVIASVVLHASIAAGLVATAAGHSRAQGTPVVTLEVDVDLATKEEPLLAPVEPPPVARVEKDEPAPNHTHPYPVDPAHEARPHDPSLHHDVHEHETPPAPQPADHEHAPDKGEPAAAAPALVADGPVMPRFTMSSSTGAVAGGHVSTTGTGTTTGTGSAAGGAGNDEVTHAASSVQVAARLVRSVEAAYPVHARADEREGDVAVEIVVDREGRVLEARVTKSAGHGFDEAALAAVRSYRFSPAQREGRAVRVRMPWSVQFRLH